MTSMRRIVLLALVLTGMLLSTGVARAAPGGDAIVEAQSFTVAANTTGSAAVTCPAGRRVVGGGVGTTSGTVSGKVRLSEPEDETGMASVSGGIARRWFTSVDNSGNELTAAVDREYRVFALCSASSDAIVQRHDISVAGSSTLDGVATCPAGRRVVGGGVGAINGVPVGGFIESSGPLDDSQTTAGTDDGDIARSWSVRVNNPPGNRDYQIFALCSANSDATVEQTSISTEGVTKNAAVDGVATCPAGRRVVGGGVATVEPEGSKYVQVSGPQDETGTTAGTEDGDIARSWYAKVKDQDDAAHVYRVFALCVTDDAGIRPGGGSAAGPGAPGAGGPDAGVPGGAPGGSGAGAMGPLLTAFSVSPRSFRVASPARPGGGATVRYTLSTVARVRFTVQRAGSGRRVGANCVRRTPANKRRARCTRYITLGGFTRQGQATSNRFKFSGRLNGRKLTRGNYRLTAVATDPDANQSAAKRTSFKIIG